jgi:hypothetical protein
LIYLTTGDEELTIQSCIEITKYIDDIAYYDDTEFLKIVNTIIPILNIKDQFAMIRFEIILGYPSILIEEPNLRSKWPLIGYNKLQDESSKWLEYKSVYNLKGSCSLLKKLSILRSKEKMAIEVFLNLLEACIDNPPLMKYFRSLPGEELQYDDLISWGVSLIHYYNNRYDNTSYLDKLKQIVEKINPKLTTVVNDKNILKGFRGFPNKYLINEIKREEISLILQSDNLYIFKIEYFSNVIPFSKDLKFNKSASSYSGGFDVDDKTIDETQNVSGEENTIYYDLSERITNEREFFKKILISLSNEKKIIVQNKYHVENLSSTPTLIRYVAFNSNLIFFN